MDKPRRPKGPGSIYARKDGRVVGEYEANGKKKYIYGKNKRDVAAKLAKAIADRDAGLVYDSCSLSVEKYMGQWLDTLKGILRSGTYRRYEEATRIHIVPIVGKVKLSKLTALQLQALYGQKLDEGLSARTVGLSTLPSIRRSSKR